MIMFVFWLLLVVVSALLTAVISSLLFGLNVGWLCFWGDLIALFVFRRRITRWFERRLRRLRREARQKQTTAVR